MLTSSEKERVARATQIVDLAFKLLELNNFHVCFAVYAGENGGCGCVFFLLFFSLKRHRSSVGFAAKNVGQAGKAEGATGRADDPLRSFVESQELSSEMFSVLFCCCF